MIALLNGHSLAKKERFVPESMSLNLAERASTATMTAGPTAPEIGVGDWLQDETEPGSGIVWRVKSVDTQQETKTRTIQLEHLINSLRDQLMFGEVKSQDMGGTAAGCTAQQAVEYILARQSDWTLGSFDYSSVSNPYNFNGDDLFSALETVSSSLDGCWWSYDFSSYPFTINITQRASTVSTELRMSRNIQTARISIDRSRMYTRIYPIGKNNLHIDGDYISRNDNIYGVISKTETDQSKETKAELYRWAEERLARHCEPTVTVTVSALDLSDATGESLDHIVLGALCRLPLPGYEVIIEEIISKISYPDKLAEPDRATVTMANIPEDVASIINNLIKSGGRGGRAAAKNAEEDHAWFVDTTDHVAMIAEGIAGEGAAEDWSRVAELLVDGNGIHQRVTEAQADIVTAYSLIDQTTTAIRLEIGTVASEVRSFIQQTPDMIHAEVGYAVSGFAHSVIEQTATYIRMEVENAASAISHSVIEQTTEYVRTEVASVASGVAWSVVTQTMTNIEQRIARKSKVYVQWNDPNNGYNELFEGDIWIKRATNRTWNSAMEAHEKWVQPGASWRSKYGDLQYVWRDDKWNLVMDTALDVENEVHFEQTDKSLAIVGHAVDTMNQNFDSKLEVTARSIRSEVSTARSQLYSVISQTATNIRAQVENVTEGLQSQIEQTASQISTSVSAAKSALYSTILQTATNIRMDVKNVTDGLQSSIEQTASQISTSVSAAKSSLYSVIKQTATNIYSNVTDYVAGNYSTIEQTASSITLSVSSAKSSLYSVIMQTATGIYTNVTDYVSGNYSTILQTSTNIAMAVKSAKDDLQSSINVEKNRISLLVEGTGANAKIKPAEIVAAINNGSSTVKISANHIQLDGDTIVGLLEGKQIGANSFMGEVFQIIGGGQLIFGQDSQIGSADAEDLIVGASVSGNTLTLTRYDGSTVNFSKAVTSVSWDWSNGTLKVMPQPMGGEFTLGSLAEGSKSQSGKTYTVPLRFVYGSQGQYSQTIRNISVNVNYTPSAYSVFTHDAPSTPDGYSRATNGYYIKDAGLRSAEVMMYTYGVMTVDGNTINGNDYALYNPLGIMPTNIYRDGYNAGVAYGYDANHGMFIGDSRYTAMPGEVNINPGSPVEVWPYFMTYNGQSYQWGPKYTFKAVNPHPNLFSLRCTKKEETYPGSTIYNYTFVLGGSSSSFSVDTPYNFYR